MDKMVEDGENERANALLNIRQKKNYEMLMRIYQGAIDFSEGRK